MLNFNDIYKQAIISESKKTTHIYENGDITFADIKDMTTDLFSNGGTLMKKTVDGLTILVTYKDGEFCVATDLKLLNKPTCYSKMTDRCCDGGKNIKLAFMNTIKDLIDALKTLDPVLLNKYFANGQNFMECSVIYPPEEYCQNYNNKCFLTFNKLKCFNQNFKEIGEDSESANELFNSLRDNSTLCQEVAEISAPHISCLRNCASGKSVIEKVIAKLNEFVDGVGWGCTINSYIQDKYSRYIINKALEHNLNVSRNSSFVNELVSRLSGTKVRPTKSDLVTFAKREGLNCNSLEYKEFLNDIEMTAEDVSAQIIQPIEDLIYYIVCSALQNIVGYMAIDPNEKTQKFLDGIDGTCYTLDENDTECKFHKGKLDPLKKNLSKVNQYIEHLPTDGVVLMYKSSPYKVISKLGKLDKLCSIIGC